MASAFGLLLGVGGKCNFLASTFATNADEWNYFRQTVIDLVLATDPSRLQSTLLSSASFRSKPLQQSPSPRYTKGRASEPDMRITSMSVILILATNAFSTKPLAQHRVWVRKQRLEASVQADLLVDLATAAGDRAQAFAAAADATSGRATEGRAAAKDQLKLFDEIIIPLYGEGAKLLHHGNFAEKGQPWAEFLKKNLKYWQAESLSEAEKSTPLKYTESNQPNEAMDESSHDRSGGRATLLQDGLSPAYAARLNAALDDSDDSNDDED
eukprot:SAG31_NODE_2922_length_4906_cov_8.279800_3_plen_269_part_00